MHLNTDIKENSARGTAVTDPVCGMTVHPDSAAGSFEYKGETYYFCSPHCQHKFEEDPGGFLSKTVHPLGAQPVGIERQGRAAAPQSPT